MTIPKSGFPACRQFVYWWDGEYEGNCELREGHPAGIHFDGTSWYNDDDEQLYLEDEVGSYIHSIYGPPKGLLVV